jgi:SAM-dependent methyltransferase
MFSYSDVNEFNRQAWLKKILESLPAGLSILDVGAGEQKNRKYCSHLKYVSQDFCKYSGGSSQNTNGLHNAAWDTSETDVVSDILDIPCSNASFDIILCSEVLEHVPEPTRALDEFSRLLKPQGILVLTIPFASFLHMAPYHFATGFTRYWYEHHLTARGFSIERLQPNGDWSEVLGQELSRLSGLERAKGSWYWPVVCMYVWLARVYLKRRTKIVDSDFACFGFNCVAVKV